MANQIFVNGYIEMPDGSAAENALTLSQIAKADSREYSLAASIDTMRAGWRAVTCGFARSYKETGPDDADRLQHEFERLLQSLTAVSAHLSIRDQDGAVQRVLDYVYGPTRFEGPNVWRRIHLHQAVDKSEELTFPAE
ncbi:MAG TPA: hypothetical protein VNG33_16015 [Polyangiaceae bacterium]|nr:hypothetical protein [Polyangiaceae bacterium]